jgi:hypothetical protein
MAKRFVLSACVFAVILSIFASGLLKPLGHDEHMYCTAGAMMAQGKLIYRDFSYVAHPPYHPLLLAAVYKVFNTSYYLLAGRLVSIICDCLVVLIIFLIYRHIFQHAPREGIYLGLAAVVLYAFNPFVSYAGGFAWNHSIVILCVGASFWLYMTLDNQKYLRIAAIAALLTFATFNRATTALIWLLFFIFIMLGNNHKLKCLGVFLFVSLLASLWPLYVIAQAPKAFYLDVFVNPPLNGQYLHEIGMAYGKLQLIRHVLTEPVYAVTILIGICLWLAAFVRRKNLSKTDTRNMTLAVCLAAAFLIIAFIPVTIWEQYFAMPVLFLIISLAYPLSHLAVGSRMRLVNLTAAAIIIVSIARNPLPLASIPCTFSISNWIPIQVHSIGEDMAAKVGKGKSILTLAPLFAIEGGCEIYPELSAGPFAYRVADSMTAEDRAAAKVAGPLEVAQMTQQISPSGIFIGTEPPLLEEPLRKIAGPDWKTKTYLDGQLILMFRPN